MMMTRGAESLVSGGVAGEVAGVAGGPIIGVKTGVRSVSFLETANCVRFALANLRGVVVLERTRDAPVRPGVDVNSSAEESKKLKGIASAYT